MFTPLGAFYIDAVLDSAASARPGIINRVPQPSETQAPEDGAIQFTIVDTGAPGLKPGTTTVTINDGSGAVVAWNGTAFHATYVAGSTFVAARSDGAGPDDEHRLSLRRATIFDSLATVEVTVHAETNDALELDVTYSFQIRDYSAPVVSVVRSYGFRALDVVFDEPVVQGTGVAGDALRVRGIATSKLIAPSGLEVPIDTFSSDDVGLYIGVAGAENSVNNALYRVSSVVSSKRVTLDGVVISETLPAEAHVAIGPYGLAGVPDPNRIIPVFTPVVVGASAGVAANRVTLTLHAELTPEGSYALGVHQVDDAFENRLLNGSATFVAEPLPVVPGREFDLLNSVPKHNLREDTSHDLERLLRCLQEATGTLLYSVDRFAEIVDVDHAPDGILDALLAHLGNPFAFVASLSTAQKRQLIDVLVEIYKRNGTEIGMEAVINFFTGIAIDISPYTGLDFWVLGIGELGVDTILAPGTSFLRYAFEANSPVELSTDQKLVMSEIINYMKPAWTHFVRFVEP